MPVHKKQDAFFVEHESRRKPDGVEFYSKSSLSALTGQALQEFNAYLMCRYPEHGFLQVQCSHE